MWADAGDADGCGDESMGERFARSLARFMSWVVLAIYAGGVATGQ